tara:strand:+ start:171 stop:1043 length:873 start_codon:yes stop_codon:yes gene_type:complete
MTKEKNEKSNNDFKLENLTSYKNCKLDIQNLQKISEKVEQTGLVALVGLSKKIVSFHNDVKIHCEKSTLKTTDYFNLTTIRKHLYDLVDYPQQEDADGKPIRNYVFENAVSRSIKLAFVLINKEKTKAEIKDNVIFAQSNVIYPHLKTGNQDVKFVPNNDKSLIKLSTRGLEMLWSTIAPAKNKKSPKHNNDKVEILDTFKEIRKILNDEILTRQKNPKYLVDVYGTSEIEQLRKIAQFALRLVEQKARDDSDFDSNGKMKNADIVNVQNIEFNVMDNKKLALTRVSKAS